MRLGKFLAHAGVASRRKAEQLIEAGRVSVAGLTERDPARSVESGDEVALDGRPIARERRQYFIVHKPEGVVSTAHDPQGRPRVVDLVSSQARLYPVGRLDLDSSGLMLLTNDGELANRVLHPRYQVPRTYRVRVAGAPSAAALDSLRSGVELEDGRTAAARVRTVKRRASQSVLEVTLREGRKRQVRRMCEAVGHPVRELKRTSIGPLGLGRLRPGQSRRLTATEIERLWQYLSNESG